MTPTEQEYREKLERRVEELERRRFSRLTRGSLFVAPLLAMALLTGSMPATGLTALEFRLLELESRIRVGPSGSTQMKVPFQVIDDRGKVLFNVSDQPVVGAVNVTMVAGSSALRLIGAGGKDVANMAVDPNGQGRISNFDANGKVIAQFNAVGLNVYNVDGKAVAGVTRGGNNGRVAVWHGENQTAVELTADAQGNGKIFNYGVNGKIRMGMHGEGGLSVYDDAENLVVTLTNRSGLGVVGVGKGGTNRLIAEMTVDTDGGGLLHMKGPDGKTSIGLYGGRRVIALGNSSGKTVAEMVVHPSGNGLFQVWGTGNLPLALLGKSVDSDGGILQISNGKAVLSSLTASGGGNGLWQLNNSSGTPIVEAGTTIGGLGTVRVGPAMKCLPRPSSLVLPDCMVGRP